MGLLTLLPGGPRERAFHHFTVGVVTSTHATLVLLLAGANYPITAHLLQGKRGQGTFKTTPLPASPHPP